MNFREKVNLGESVNLKILKRKRIYNELIAKIL